MFHKPDTGDRTGRRLLSLIVSVGLLVGVTACSAGADTPTASPGTSEAVPAPTASLGTSEAASAPFVQLAIRPVELSVPEGSPVPAPVTGSDQPPSQPATEPRQSTDPNVRLQALAALDCAAPDPLRGRDDLTLPLVTCAADGSEKFVLGPAALTNAEVRTASRAFSGSSSGYAVVITFTEHGAQQWGQLSQQYLGKRVTFVLDTLVVSAPSIAMAPLGDSTEISGIDTADEAARIAAGITRQAPPTTR